MIGTVLLLGVVMIAFGTFMVAGDGSLGEARESVNEEVVKQELGKIAGEAEPVIFGSNERVSVSLGIPSTDGQQTLTLNENQSSMTVTVGGTEVYNRSLGTIIYQAPARAFAYQSGGVFQMSENGNGRVIAEPPMTFANDSAPTLTLPIVELTGDVSPRTSLTVNRTSVTELYQPPDVAASDTIEIQVESSFAPAWKRYFNESVGLPESQISMSSDRTRVTATFDWGTDGFAHISRRVLSVST